MNAVDQAVYNEWALNVGVLYGTIALVMIVAVALTHHSGSYDAAVATAASTPSPR
jgi:hypothetical protein